MCHLISNLKSIFSSFISRVGSVAKVILAAVLFTSFSVSASASTTVGESPDFVNGPNATWVKVITLAVPADGASSQGAQTLSINVTALPDGGANYRVYKTAANGSDFFASAQALAVGANDITVGGVSFDRAVKIQFSSSEIAFDALSVNGVVLYTDTSADDGSSNEPAAGITLDDSSDFYDKSHATWVKVIDLALSSDGASSQAAQTLSMNVTELPAGGANYRVYKTTANGGDFFGNASALVDGANNISVGGVAFDRTVKLQFSSADVRFDSLSVNGTQLYPEVPGCTDSAADNYNAAATTDDGSCVTTPATMSVTFSVDMSAVDTNADGVYIAGGGFGQDGHALTDDGNDVWSVTLDLAPNAQYMYKFRNQPSYGTWDGFEDAAGLIAGECNIGQYNDRFVDVAEADIVLDTVAYGSCTAEPYVAPVITIPTAPVPTDAADSVLSIFGTTYGNLAGADFNPNWGQSTSVEVGDNLGYSNLNYQGTAYANQNVSGYEYLNVDYYVTESTALNFFLIGAGGETSVALDVSTLDQWVNVQIPLTSYSSVVNLADVFQFKVEGNGTVAFNNIYFGGVVADIPGCTDDTASNYDAAATEDNGSCVFAVGTLSVGDSIDFAAPIALESFGGTDGSIADGVLTVVKNADAATWAGNVLARGQVVFPLTATDNLVTVDVNSSVPATIRMKLESAADGSQSAEVDSTVAHTGSGWETLTFDFAGTGAIDANFDVLVLFSNFDAVGAGNTYQYDNITFAGGVTPEPEVPTTVSVTFSVDMSAVDTNADGVYIAGGDVFGQDGVLMTDNGSDVWTATVDLDMNTQVLYKFRNQPSYGTWDGFEDPAGLIEGSCNTGQYNDRFVDVAEADIVLGTVAYGSCTADPYVPPAGPEVPAAPAATDAADSVLSIFSTTYGNLDGTDFNPNWGQSTSVEVGDNLLYTGLNYQGTAYANSDVSGYAYLNVGYYVVESTALNFFLIGAGGETSVALDVSTLDQWVNVQIPLTSYSSVVNLADVFQFKVDGNGSVAFNNIYFGGVADVPGCTDDTASNYDAAATSDDGSCTFPEPPAGITAGESSAFANGPNATWVKVIALAVPADGASSQGAQTLSINVTALPDGGANYRVYKTTANGSDFFASAQALSLGANDITVGGVSFDRAVKIQLSSADVRFDALSVNGTQVYPEPADPTVAVFDGAFGGVVVDGDTYTFPTGAEGWAGVANNNAGLYPISLEHGGTLTFTGSADSATNVYFRFEKNPHPDTEPSYNTTTVEVSGAASEYSVALDPQGANTFSSFILYVVDRDLPVSVSNVKVTAAEAPPEVPGCTDSAADNYNAAATTDDGSCVTTPATMSVTFSVDMSAVDTNADGVYIAGGGFGQDGHALTDDGNDVWSVTLDLAPNAQYMYKFRNQPSYGTWDGFEDAAGLIAGECNIGQYNDRFVDVAEADIVLDTVAYGSCTAEPYVAPVITIPTAPVPTDAADSVLSIFGTTYGNLAGADFNPNWGQSTSVEVGDNLGYSNLNYQGTAYANQNVSGYEYLNVDYYVTESTALNFFLIGAGGETSVALDVSTLDQWVNVQIPLTSYSSVVNLADVFQFKVEGNGTVAFNNIYFGGVVADIPGCTDDTASNYDAAATEDNGSCVFAVGTLSVGDSIDFAAPIALESFGGTDGSIADGVLTVVKNADAATWAGNVLARGQVVFPLTATDNLVTVDVNSSVPATIRMKLESAADGSQSAEVDSTVAHTGSGWETLTFDFAGTGAIDANFDVLVLFSNFDAVGAGNTYQYDNITFAGGVTPEPEVPTTVSVTFSVDMSAVDTNADGVYIAGGDVFGQDGVLMTDNGSDVWTATVDLDMNTQVLYKFRNQPSYGTWDGFEDPAGLIEGSCNTGQYNDRFVDVAEADIVLGTVAYGSCTADPYVPPAGPEVPAAPAATDAADSVLSIFSTTYGNLDGTDFNPNWGQSTSVEVGDNLLYTGLNYQGTAYANSDVSGYAYLNVGYYVVESTALNFFLIGAGGETSVALDVSTLDQWVNVQIPLTSYSSVVNLADVFQFKVDGNGSVAFNNIYFGGVADVPGCTDDTASNYDAAATSDDGSCTFPDPTVAVFDGAFGGVVVDGDTYTFPTGAEEWAGVANNNAGLYPFTFPHGGSISFTGAAPQGDVNVRFRFEYNAFPDVDPAYDTVEVTVTGTDEANYTVDIPSRDQDTFSSFLLYVVDRDQPVIVKDVRVTAAPDPSLAVFDGAFGGVEVDGDTYTFPTGAEGWAGVANNNTGLYPISLDNGGTLTFTGSADSPVSVYFRFEFNPYPDVEPSYNTDSVEVSGEASEYSIDIPALGTNTYSSFLLYIQDRDLPVSVSNVKVTANGANWDFDGNGHMDALTDGLLLVRYAFGLRGDMLSVGVTALDSTLTSAEVEARLVNAHDISDIDSNGVVDPLSDGLLLLRHLFGLEGDDLVKGVVDPDGTRTSASEIVDYINAHMP
jgi:azurin